MLRKPAVKGSFQNSPETDEILRRMEEVRCDLDEGAHEIAESAREMGEWRHYVKNYPWISAGVACAVGYLIVPRRRLGVRKVDRTLDEIADHSRSLTQSQTASTRGIRTAVLMFAGNLLLRSALSYATQQANQYLAARSVKSPPEDHHDQSNSR
jgi:hypothetical protein